MPTEYARNLTPEIRASIAEFISRYLVEDDCTFELQKAYALYLKLREEKYPNIELLSKGFFSVMIENKRFPRVYPLPGKFGKVRLRGRLRD